MISGPTGRGDGELRWFEKDDTIIHDSYFQYFSRRRFGRTGFGRSDGRGSSGGASARAGAGLSSAELSGLTG